MSLLVLISEFICFEEEEISVDNLQKKKTLLCYEH